MAKNKTTFIKLDRNILEWRWYRDQNTKALFIHLLIKANVVEHDFETAHIPRGSLATSYASLAAETGLSIRNIRTALKHLQETGEVTVNRHSHFSVISIPKYDYYQSQVTVNRQASDKQVTGNRQQYKNDKNVKEGEERAHARDPQPAALSKEEDDGWVSYRNGKEVKKR